MVYPFGAVGTAVPKQLRREFLHEWREDSVGDGPLGVNPTHLASPLQDSALLPNRLARGSHLGNILTKTLLQSVFLLELQYSRRFHRFSPLSDRVSVRD